MSGNTARASGRIVRQFCVWVFVPVALVLSSCATARVNHFDRFAEAGVAYTRAAETVLDEAGKSAMATDSMVLERVRPSLSPEERGETILAHNKELRERLILLGDLKRHGQLLRTYFEALGALAESDSPSGIGEAASGVVDSLGKLNQRIASAEVGEFAVSGFIGKVAGIAVANFQLGALEKELKANAGTIERELDLQKAALTAVTEQMRTDLQFQLQQQESREVVQPYAAESPLPANWPQRRQEVLQANLEIASVSAAADAAEKLKISFISLVEGRFTEADLPALISDINEVVTLIEDIRGDQRDSSGGS